MAARTVDPKLAALIGFGFLPLVWIALERRWPSIRGQRVLRRGVGPDAVCYVVEAHVARLLARWGTYLVLLPVMALYGMNAERFYSGFGPVSRIPFWWQVPVVFVLADFLSHWQHRRFHRRAIWPIHAVHHASRELACGFHPWTLLGFWRQLACPFAAAWHELAARARSR